ncbi:hypothetical protein AVEN_61608-1 [Araneus ventricosus]|uniref:Uncharacterized protein n=1 Tax=Araneus ventricosus TaxID=182803 RepID=A0A4Y2DGC8_ARAVE|nr:hypothetical protein AVEN_61608-1 [Araneus ventricosus]
MCTKATDPFVPYKAIIKNRHPPVDIFKLLGNLAKGDTSVFESSILKELYPPAQDPGILNLLHSYFNKCLQLNSFPAPLKEVIIVLFNKNGKVTTKIKSYRPVTLLPTNESKELTYTLKPITSSTKTNLNSVRDCHWTKPFMNLLRMYMNSREIKILPWYST